MRLLSRQTQHLQRRIPAFSRKRPLPRQSVYISHYYRPKGSSHMQIAEASPSDVLVLDFDGVIVDSEPEVSMSGYAAAAKLWPDLFTDITDGDKATLMEGLKTVRPALISGWECMVMARMLRNDPGCSSQILESWEQLLPVKMVEYGLDKAELRKFFEVERNTFMNGEDSSIWLGMNQPYPGVKEVLQQCQFPFYIASSKAGHRLAKLLQEVLELDIPETSPRMFAALIPPNEMKINALKSIGQRPMCQSEGVRLHFVDDRWETLRAIHEDPDLAHWNLHLANWGYNTAHERAEAAATKRVKMMSLPGFIELVKWGIVMGVDDGCEPTQEEVDAQVF